MSQENVETVQAAYDAFARADLANVLALSDPDIEVVEAAELPGARTYHGHQGLLDALDNWAGQWEDFHIEIERIVDVGDCTVSLVHQRARGKVSGAPVELRVAYVHTIKNGGVVPPLLVGRRAGGAARGKVPERASTRLRLMGALRRHPRIVKRAPSLSKSIARCAAAQSGLRRRVTLKASNSANSFVIVHLVPQA